MEPRKARQGDEDGLWWAWGRIGVGSERLVLVLVWVAVLISLEKDFRDQLVLLSRNRPFSPFRGNFPRFFLFLRRSGENFHVSFREIEAGRFSGALNFSRMREIFPRFRVLKSKSPKTFHVSGEKVVR